ncbi:MAG: 1-deoxy-D-xylulose-5-phosphate synthase [Deltaproteobacteria bacterium]|jgi:1-deoxy-D-xylulose-5-phosphate synthase|nr:1-deoxy-D-xylulose-5-phosphate synthase [Deltaproteobacteria bacterium]
MTERKCVRSGSLLSEIASPLDVAALDESLLPKLALELRDKILHSVSRNGGHLASSLGVVELTIALLRLFDPGRDRIIWDVGHQAYAYKILTGRRDSFDSLRQGGGLSGFPKLSESPCDHFGGGHASVSISAALGMVSAREISGRKHHVVAIIGDGALTGGMAYEAMNHAGAMNRRLIVILNDNQMSISKNVGALSYFMSRNLSSRWMRRVRREVADFLQSVPGVGEEILNLAKQSKKSFKTFFTPGILFEALNFNYLGPVDGHNQDKLHEALSLAVSNDSPILVHVLTQKGRGYTLAESSPGEYHGVSRFNLLTGKVKEPGSGEESLSYTEVFSSGLCELAARDAAVFAITAAMPEGTGLAKFSRLFPGRFADVGICEQHAVTYAAGLATQGMKPVVAVYSTFMQRAYDQVLHDVALQNLPVVFALDRAGLVGEDGPTHHGVFDMAFLRHIPNLHILSPRGQGSLRDSLATALSLGKPAVLRYPRGQCPFLESRNDFRILAPGNGEFLRRGKEEVAVIAVGGTVIRAWEAINEILEESGREVTLFDPVWIKPLPEEQLADLAGRHPFLLILEEHVLAGGFGSSVLEFFNGQGLLGKCRVVLRALPDVFVEHGSSAELRAKYGLDKDGFKKLILAHLG